MKRSLLIVSLFVLYCLFGYAQGTTVLTNASPKTAAGITFTLSGSAEVGTFGAGSYAFRNQVGVSRPATVSISAPIRINWLYFSN